MNKTCQIIDDTPYISDIGKNFYKKIIELRYEKILKCNYDKLNEKSLRFC